MDRVEPFTAGVPATEVGPRLIARHRRSGAGDDDGGNGKVVECASVGEEGQVPVPCPRPDGAGPCRATRWHDRGPLPRAVPPNCHQSNPQFRKAPGTLLRHGIRPADMVP